LPVGAVALGVELPAIPAATNPAATNIPPNNLTNIVELTFLGFAEAKCLDIAPRLSASARESKREIANQEPIA
jgi:hypothetical protein